MNVNKTTTKTDFASEATQEYAIELVEVTKHFGDNVVLHGISLDIPNGEFLVLLGPSGCGKSTILKIISGLEDATEGEVYIQGRLVNYVAPKERDVAMVFQNYALYPHMTVGRNIGFPLEMRHVPKNELRPKVLEVAQLLEIEQFMDKYPDQLSGGQRQRVALGRALIRDPIAFLLDEPLSNLDALLRVQMRDELLKFHRRIGRTILYVTHDQVEAMTMADRIVILKSGVVQQVGKPNDVYMRPTNTFVATFVGSPQMNLVSGTVTESADGLEFTGPIRFSLGRRFAFPGKGPNVTLGIRPEDISVVADGQPNGISGQVGLVEDIGSDTFLDVEVDDGVSFKVRVPVSARIHEGERATLKIEVNDVHLFDSDGQRVAEV
jgi:ABC-type sugar transport system ATPase subunit